MGSAENGGGQHPAPKGSQIGTPPPPGMFMTPSLSFKKQCEKDMKKTNKKDLCYLPNYIKLR